MQQLPVNDVDSLRWHLNTINVLPVLEDTEKNGKVKKVDM